jgi:hypothetical protein
MKVGVNKIRRKSKIKKREMKRRKRWNWYRKRNHLKRSLKGKS